MVSPMMGINYTFIPKKDKNFLNHLKLIGNRQNSTPSSSSSSSASLAPPAKIKKWCLCEPLVVVVELLGKSGECISSVVGG